MKISFVILVGVCVLQGHQINGRSKKRWIPERYSDDDFGLEFAPTQANFDASQSGQSHNPYQQNYPSYYFQDYFYPQNNANDADRAGMNFRANDNPNHVMLDPVQQLNNVQAYSYAQTFQNPYLTPYRPGPGGPANMPGEVQVGADHAQPAGRSNFIVGTQQSQPQMFFSPQQAFMQQSPSPVFVMQAPSASTANMFQPAGASPMIFFMPSATQNTQGAFPMFASPAAGQQVMLAETFQQSQPAFQAQALPANQQMFFFPSTTSFGSNANVFAAPMVETAQVQNPAILVTNDEIELQGNNLVDAAVNVVVDLAEGLVGGLGVNGANAAEEVIVEEQNIQYSQTEEGAAADEVAVKDANEEVVVDIEDFAANAQNEEEEAEFGDLVEAVQEIVDEVKTIQESKPAAARQLRFEEFLAAFKRQQDAETSKDEIEEAEFEVENSRGEIIKDVVIEFENQKQAAHQFHNVHNQAKGLHSRAYSYPETPSPAASYGPTSADPFYNPLDIIYPGVNSPGNGYRTTTPIYYNPGYTTPPYLQQPDISGSIYNPYSPPYPQQYTSPITSYGSATYKQPPTYSPTSYASSGNAAYTYPGYSQSSVSTVPTTTTYGGSYYEQVARDTRSPGRHSGIYRYGVQMPRVG